MSPLRLLDWCLALMPYLKHGVLALHSLHVLHLGSEAIDDMLHLLEPCFPALTIPM